MLDSNAGAKAFWEGQRVLVTGAGGFIGSWAVCKLLARGAMVRATVRPGPIDGTSLGRNLETVACDLQVPEACREICRGQEIVFSFAHADGSTDYKRQHPALMFRQNISITLNLMEAAAHSGVKRMLITSSAEVYSPAAPIPATEPDAFRNLEDTLNDGYSWSKRMSELAASLYSREFGMHVSIARPSNVYGPGDTFDPSRGRVIPMFIQQALRGGPILIWGDGEQVRTFLHVEDFVHAALDLAERGANCQPVNFAGREEITIRRLAELIVELSGQCVEIQCDRQKPSGVARRIVDTTLAETLLQFQPRIGLAEGLQQAVEFYKGSGRRNYAHAH